VESVQIIFNIFRQRPAELFFDQAKRKKVAILARVPLASGLLTGKLTAQSTFEDDDHRKFNRHGEEFDRGETFAGVDYKTGLGAVDELRSLVPAEWSMAQFALRWITMFEAVSCVIPGAKTPKQAEDNVRAADLPPLAPATMDAVRALYEERIRPLVHHYW
jgi:aryl-alcohol dehydrogenase-like predicted oxidoreductase